MGLLEDQVAMVTGAGSGIGAATVRRFAREGAAIVCVDIDDAAGTGIADEVEEAGGRATFQHADVGELVEMETAVNAAVNVYGGLHVMHNNAWVAGGGYISQLDPADWERGLRICLTGVFHGMRAAIPPMLEQGGGAIVNMSSVDGLFGERGAAPYAAAKAGVINLTRTAALEYGRRNIRVNAVCPGSTDTPALAFMESISPGFKAQSATEHATGRLIHPDEIAAVVTFLASSESSALTGTAVVADAGLTASYRESFLPPFGEGTAAT